MLFERRAVFGAREQTVRAVLRISSCLSREASMQMQVRAVCDTDILLTRHCAFGAVNRRGV